MTNRNPNQNNNQGNKQVNNDPQRGGQDQDSHRRSQADHSDDRKAGFAGNDPNPQGRTSSGGGRDADRQGGADERDGGESQAPGRKSGQADNAGDQRGSKNR